MPATGKIYELAAHYTSGGQQMVNVFHFRAKTGSGTANGLADSFASAFIPNLTDMVVSNVQYTLLSVKERTHSDTQDQYDRAGTWNGNALLAPPAFAPTLAVVFSMKTDRVGRSYRGRWYQGGLADLYTLNGVITGVSVTKVTAAATGIVTQFGGDGATQDYVLGVFSRKHFIADTATPDTWFRPMISLAPKLVLGTMRSRRPGHGS